MRRLVVDRRVVPEKPLIRVVLYQTQPPSIRATARARTEADPRTSPLAWWTFCVVMRIAAV